MTTVAQMTWFDQNGWFKDEEPEAEAEFIEERRVVVVDGVAGYVSCPDCTADERLTDTDLLALDWEQPVGPDGDLWAGVDCNRCKDTGKVWVSI